MSLHKTIKAGIVTLDGARYSLMTIDDPLADCPKWIADTDIKGKALINPDPRHSCFAPGVPVQIMIEGRYYYRKLQPIDLQEKNNDISTSESN